MLYTISLLGGWLDATRKHYDGVLYFAQQRARSRPGYLESHGDEYIQRLRALSQSSDFETQPGMPSKQMNMSMIGKLKQDGILKTVREGSGCRAQALALAELINLCAGRAAI